MGSGGVSGDGNAQLSSLDDLGLFACSVNMGVLQCSAVVSKAHTEAFS